MSSICSVAPGFHRAISWSRGKYRGSLFWVETSGLGFVISPQCKIGEDFIVNHPIPPPLQCTASRNFQAPIRSEIERRDGAFVHFDTE